MKEVLTKEQLEELRQFDSPTVNNALETFDPKYRIEGFMKPGMTPRTKLVKPMIGYAATAKVSAMHPGKPENADFVFKYYETVREMPDPTIAVIQDIDPSPIGSFWGEVQATTHMALGAVGTLTDGGVRDLKEVEELGFSFFSTALLVSHAFIHVENYDCPVDVCGLAVYPGDLLFCDVHGVVRIPHEVAPKLAAACRKIAAAELPVLEPCRAAIKAGRKPTIDELRTWRKEMEKKRKEV
ncbi:MAG: RraA family protein [Treponemataceae bacterium]